MNKNIMLINSPFHRNNTSIYFHGNDKLKYKVGPRLDCIVYMGTLAGVVHEVHAI